MNEKQGNSVSLNEKQGYRRWRVSADGKISFSMPFPPPNKVQRRQLKKMMKPRRSLAATLRASVAVD